MSGPRTPTRRTHPVPPAARADHQSLPLRRGWSASPGWRRCSFPGSPRRARSCGRTSPPSSTPPTATKGRRGSRTTACSGGNGWLRRTSTGLSPTHVCIARHSRAARKLCRDASTASRRTMAARAAPNTLIPWWWVGSNPPPPYLSPRGWLAQRQPRLSLPPRPQGVRSAGILMLAGAATAAASSPIHAQTVQAPMRPWPAHGGWQHRRAAARSRGPAAPLGGWATNSTRMPHPPHRAPRWRSSAWPQSANSLHPAGEQQCCFTLVYTCAASPMYVISTCTFVHDYRSCCVPDGLVPINLFNDSIP